MVAGIVSAITGGASVCVTVTVLAGSVSVAAGNVSVTVAAGVSGTSSVVPNVTVVSVSPSGGEVVAGRVTLGMVCVIAVESAPLPPPPQPAVASATRRPSKPAAT